MILHQLINSKSIITKHGDFKVDTYYNGKEEAIVLSIGDLREKNDVLCRIQSTCLNHYFFDVECDCLDQMESSLEMITKEGQGLIILLHQEGKGNGFSTQFNNNVKDSRNYKLAAKIINERYRINSINLITLNKHKIDNLQQNGIEINRTIWYMGKYIKFKPALERTISEIIKEEAICPIQYEFEDNNSGSKKRVLICGDLNIDRFLVDPPKDYVGGTGYNAARALHKYGFMPIIFGSVGNDDNGKLIEDEIKNLNLYAIIRENNDLVDEESKTTKKTAVVKIHKTGDPSHPFNHEWDTVNNANDYDNQFFKKTITLSNLNKNDFVFITSYLFLQKKWDIVECKKFFSEIKKRNARIILDFAKSSFRKCEATKRMPFNLDQFLECINGCELFLLVDYFNSMVRLTNNTFDNKIPESDDYELFFNKYGAKYIICRYGARGDTYQDTYCNL